MMLIGVPREIKNHEYRVGLTPVAAAEAVRGARGGRVADALPTSLS